MSSYDKLFRPFSTFLSRFSYRKKFLFFAFLYVIAMPAPSLYMISTQNHFLNQVRLQKEGVTFVYLYDLLLKSLVEYQILSSSQDHFLKDAAFLQEIESAINDRFKGIQERNLEVDFTVVKPLGFGFSSLPKPKLFINELSDHWKNLLQKKKEEKQKELAKLIAKCKQVIVAFGYSFGLLFDQDDVNDALSQFNVNVFPERLELIGRLVVLQMGDLKEIKSSLQSLKENSRFWGGEFLRSFPFQQLTKPIEKDLETYLRLIEKAKWTEIKPLALRLLKANQEIVAMIAKILEDRIENEKQSLLYHQWMGLSLLLVCTGLVIFFVMNRTLTRHFTDILTRIQDQKQSKWTSKDDFGVVGRALNQAIERKEKLTCEIKKIATLFFQVTKEAKMDLQKQEKVIQRQEEGLIPIEGIAREMIAKVNLLAKMLDGLNQLAKESNINETVMVRLKRMQEKIVELKELSSKIIDKLIFSQSKVSQTSALIDCLISISDQTKLLSVNAAIETANIDRNQATFLEITQHIERFSNETVVSTNRIKEIVHEIAENVSLAITQVSFYLKEISEGAASLVAISYRFSGIAKGRDEQVKKFEAVNQTMQSQALSGNALLQAITALRNVSLGNKELLKELDGVIERIGSQAVELEKVVEIR